MREGDRLMKFRTLALATAAASLAASPAIAQVAFERASAPVEGESEVAAGAPTLLLGLLGAAAVVGIVVAASDDDDDPVSP
ncbi:hypothetical protein NAP1_00760 [Erythrobacter sp. NAP1]|nr:hypothetical protein NAP1_00760 [Erythrobacter sp. NAP1]